MCLRIVTAVAHLAVPAQCALQALLARLGRDRELAPGVERLHQQRHHALLVLCEVVHGCSPVTQDRDLA